MTGENLKRPVITFSRPRCGIPITYSEIPSEKGTNGIWSEWRLTVIAATVRIALVDILDLSEVNIPAGGFLHPAVGWG